MATQYWLSINGDVFGPHTAAEIRHFAAEGTVSPNDQITIDQIHWTPLHQVDGLWVNQAIPAPEAHQMGLPDSSEPPVAAPYTGAMSSTTEMQSAPNDPETVAFQIFRQTFAQKQSATMTLSLHEMRITGDGYSAVVPRDPKVASTIVSISTWLTGWVIDVNTNHGNLRFKFPSAARKALKTWMGAGWSHSILRNFTRGYVAHTFLLVAILYMLVGIGAKSQFVFVVGLVLCFAGITSLGIPSRVVLFVDAFVGFGTALSNFFTAIIVHMHANRVVDSEARIGLATSFGIILLIIGLICLAVALWDRRMEKRRSRQLTTDS